MSKIKIGQMSRLRVASTAEHGIYLDGGDDGQILVPTKELEPNVRSPRTLEIGSELEVFVYFDSEDRLIATMRRPLAMVGDIALLSVVSTTQIGAFLDWGLAKDLFLPFAEQLRPLSAGQKIFVAIYQDKSERISASMRIERYLNKEVIPYHESERVSLTVYGKSDLGYKALIRPITGPLTRPLTKPLDGSDPTQSQQGSAKFTGIVYHDEVFKPLEYGQELTGFIKTIRPDGKIDLRLHETGHQAASEIAPMILQLLKQNNGFVDLNDKTSADRIHALFGVSKKKYKIALGDLYKKRLIDILPDGIRLL